MLTIRIDEKSFPAIAGAQGRVVFQDFLLEVPDGQICVLGGPSGVGKSTLLSIVSGVDRDFRGTVTGRASPVGFMFQTPRLLPWLTALRNVELAIAGREADAGHWLAAVGLAGHENEYPQRLSGGMVRRVALARAIAVAPALLLLDEPFASLDNDTAAAMRLLLRDLIAKSGVTVLLVTHDFTHASPLADRIVVMEGTPARIVRDVAITRGMESDAAVASRSTGIAGRGAAE
ncbi:ABC transporter ATP-binding protein [Mesorhizobium sp. M1423]|uniref:ABC transporter ATP-binding protein n=1 Tax=Mesorhizobium sp. M1423 TaxID=2957101 RepID=UPI0033357DA5